MSSRTLNVKISYNMRWDLSDEDTERFAQVERGEGDETVEDVICDLVNQRCFEIGGIREGEIECWSIGMEVRRCP